MIPVLLDSTSSPAGPGEGRTSVVLVDDEPDFVWLTRRFLERDGDFAVVAEAGDGVSGVDAVRTHAPHVVLLDIEMPHMDGIAALAAIRRDSPTTRVVMLTALSSASRLDAALAGGAAGIIRKGSSLANMVVQLRNLLGRTDLATVGVDRSRPQSA